MQKEKENEAKEESKKIDYTIRTMNSDMKNKGFSSSSFGISKKNNESTEQKSGREEKEKEIEEQKKNKNPQPETQDPFLNKLESDPIKEKDGDEKEIAKEREEKKKEKEERERKLKDKNNETPQKKPRKSLFSFKKNDKQSQKPPTNPSSLEKAPERKSGLNKKLLIVLFFAISTTMLAGVYYYISFSPKESKTAPQKSENPAPPLKSKPETTQKTTPKNLPKQLKNSEVLSISEEVTDLKQALLTKKEVIANNSGKYYQIYKKDKALTHSEIIPLLNIQFPKELLAEFEKAWFMLYNQDDILKPNLIFQTKEDSKTVEDFFKNNEYRLPELLKNLFIDEDFVLQKETTEFQDSQTLKGVRFYNFVEGVSKQAIDWILLENDLLILSTSEETMAKILTDFELLDSENNTGDENTP